MSGRSRRRAICALLRELLEPAGERLYPGAACVSLLSIVDRTLPGGLRKRRNYVQ